MRRSPLAIATVAVVMLMASPSVLGQSRLPDEPSTRVEGSPVSEPSGGLSAQMMREAWEQAELMAIERQNLLKARRRPSRVAARERSRTQFRGMGRPGAARLAEQQFAALVRTPAAGPLSSGETADRYVGRFTARVRGDAPGGRDAFVVSGHPLRVENEAGELAPVDISLGRRGDGWAPVNALERYRIGADAGTRFSDQALSVSPVGQRSDGEIVGETVFFANTDTDTDTLVKPMTDGVQYAWQLRSGESPETLALEFDLPAGATLSRATDHGVDIVRDGEPIGQISPAIAFDADEQPLKATLRLDGDRVLVDVPHRGKDVAYPIMVDPEVVAGFYFVYAGNDASNWPYWFTYDNGRMDVWGGDGAYGRGLHIASQNYPQYISFYTGTGPADAENAGTIYNAPGNARIYKVYNTLSRFIAGEYAACMVVGIANMHPGGWAGDYGYTWGEGCAPFNAYAWTVQTANGAAQPGNRFIFGAYAHWATATAFQMYFQDAEIRMYDEDAPTVMQVNAPDDDWLNEHHTGGLRGFAKDTSTGVKSITFSAGGWAQSVVNPHCAYGPCSKEWDNGGTWGDPVQHVPVSALPEGRINLAVTARDPAGNPSPAASIPLKVDHTGPYAPTDFDARYDADTGLTDLSWAPPSDPNLADDTPGSGVAGYRYRTAVNGGGWSSWTETQDSGALLAGVTENASVQVEVSALDLAGNHGPALQATENAVQSTATYANPGPGSGVPNEIYPEPVNLVDENGIPAPLNDDVDDVPPGWGGAAQALLADPYVEANCTSGTNPACGTYNGYAAANYALRWAYERNPNYGFYVLDGGDCTNFVSQALKAGGMEFMRAAGWNQPSSPNGAIRFPFLRGEGSWWSRWWSNSPRMYEPTASFVRVEVLYRHLLEYGLAIQVGNPLANAREGDVIFYSSDPDDPIGLKHAQIVSRVKAKNGQVIVSQHSGFATKPLTDSISSQNEKYGPRGVGWNFWVLRPIYTRANIPAGTMP